MKKIIICNFCAVGVLSLLGCSQSSFSPVPGAESATPVVASADLSCLAHIVDYRVDTSIDSFQLTGGAGFGIGKVLQTIGLDMTYSSGQLDMSMNTSAPIYGGDIISGASGSGRTNNFSLGVSGLAGILLGKVDAWNSTSLATVSSDALNKTFSNLSAKLQLTAQPWFRVVTLLIDSHHFMIPIGSTAGVQVGDTFSVYKAKYIWQNSKAPCASSLAIALKAAGPYATLTVENVANFDSVVSVDPNVTTPVELNDLIEVKKLTPAVDGSARTRLKSSVQVGVVTQSGGLQFSDGKTTQAIDITPFVKSEFQTLLETSKGSFYLVR